MSRQGATSIAQAVERRGEADERPSYFVYVILPFLLIIGGLIVVAAMVFAGALTLDEASFAGAAAAALVVFLVAVVAAIVLTVMGIYKLIKRRNEHIGRDRLLRQGTLELCREAARGASDEETENDLEALERIHNEAELEESERSPALHLILFFLVPFWSFYVIYFLLKDMPRHTRRQARFTAHTSSVLSRHEGREVAAVPAIKEHSFGLAVLGMMFIPFWNLLVYWWLFKDPVEHFDAQWRHEDALLQVAQEEPREPTGDEGGSQPRAEDETAPAAPAFTVWTCGECAKKYKVPPKRPVKVTCKACGNQEILRG